MKELNCNSNSDSDIFWTGGEEVEHSPAPASASFGIAELARQFGVSLRTLRFYESKGLLAPRRNGKDRTYSAADRDRLALILKGKKLGFTLTEISKMIAGQEGRASSQDLRISRQRCRDQIALLERQLVELQEALNELRRIDYLLSQDGKPPVQDSKAG